MIAPLHYSTALSSVRVFQSLFLICFLVSSTASAASPPQTATAPFSGDAAAADSLRPVRADSVTRVVAGSDSLQGVSAAVVQKKNDAQTNSSVPEGFVLQRFKKGETLMKLCGQDSLCQAIFMKVNRTDRKYIPSGRTVLLPVDIEKASRYVPVPECLTDSRGEREIRVFLVSQYFGAYEWGKLLFWGPVSTGRKAYPTTPGKFFVNYKQKNKRSIKYDNAPMPYSINYYGGYFMHQQSLPGYPASHGCVRLLMSDARKLFKWIRVRDAVTVVAKGE
ncbi:MAG: L,D-transpeptidase [Chlorobium sp.]|jgi:hypothetical protein|uniref:L,D-transpeptidase n=1 Tax=Chlorobium sp. TaxID=1095 RepID=UPI001D2F104C|nr:L,D-transpeptidase [Chlorobium sp.]MBN1279698.1 L,D-transpeptidase [Chlorobiaceae bacterium]MCF8216413.1 L,D-transpeptidase [Chlorobium sp.]MCF8271316.1 L,D-transpeptidase [Chlorobium sp.]MCF8287690.1 L,D-transpeptidase [Chlorobium sp.]MCF8291229.1 L,D-transpeptidase [Chlorobium sp.]